MAILRDNGNRKDDSIGIAFMEGDIGTHDMSSVYSKIAKLPEFKSPSDIKLWTPPIIGTARANQYAESDRSTHEGAMFFGHTALILRKSGVVSKVIGFVPAGDSWPCPGEWMNNLPMLNDPMALSYELADAADAALVENAMRRLELEPQHYGFKYDMPKGHGSANPDTYNCIGAALTVLILTTRQTQKQWIALRAFCESCGYSQSQIKQHIMLGSFVEEQKK